VASIKLGRLLLAEGDARGARESWEGAVTLCREVGSRKDQVEVILALGSLALHEGDRDSARRHFAEGLSMVRTAGDPGSVAMGLEGVARVQLAIGNDAEATRLMGAAAAILKHRRMASGSAEKAVRESTIHDMQNRLGMPAFEQAWRAGEELPMDEAIARALSL
jgi:hypothetical protein